MEHGSGTNFHIVEILPFIKLKVMRSPRGLHSRFPGRKPTMWKGVGLGASACARFTY